MRLPAQFGTLDLDGNRIHHFKDESRLHEDWISSGASMVEPQLANYIEPDVTWEQGPMTHLEVESQLNPNRHEGFWQHMNTICNVNYLKSIWLGRTLSWRIL